MSDDTEFDSAFAEATDTQVDTQQPTDTVAAGGATEPADKEPQSQEGSDQADKVDTPPDTQASDAAALEVEAAGGKTDQQPAEKQEPAAQAPEPVAAPVQQPLDPKFLAAAIAEAQQLAEKSKPAAPAEPAKPLTADDFLTDDDRKSIEAFKTEWPTEYVAVTKMYDAKLKAELGNYQTKLMADLNGVLAPLYQSVGTVQVNSHTATIKAAHPDAASLVPAVTEWVKSQPSYAQPVMMQILEKGNAAQVVELLNDFKKSLAKPDAAPVTPAPAAENKDTTPKKGVVDPAAVAALAAVPAAQRPTPAARPSDNDFDAAFDEAIGQS